MPAPRPQPGRNCTMTPASSPSLLPRSTRETDVSVPGVTHRPPTQSGHPRACPPHPVLHQPPGPLVPQTRTPRLHILGPTGFLIRKPRQLAAQIGSPHLFRFLRALSVWVCVSQTSSGASVCSRRDPRADHGLPAAVSPASFHRGLPWPWEPATRPSASPVSPRGAMPLRLWTPCPCGAPTSTHRRLPGACLR